jgi:adenylylsulfate kinase
MMSDRDPAPTARLLRVPGVLLTGHPSAGKSTLGRAVVRRLTEANEDAELLDGDELRTRISPPLGFEPEDRSHQFSRALFIAELLAAHRVIPVLALVAPRARDRERAHERFVHVGWIEVHLDPPRHVLVERDSRSLYAALKGRGGCALVDREVFDVYERPRAPRLRIDTSRTSVDEAANEVCAAIHNPHGA